MVIVSTRLVLSWAIFIVAILGSLAILYLFVTRKIGRGYLIAPAFVIIHTVLFYGYVLFDNGFGSDLNALWSSVLRLHELTTLLAFLYAIGTDKRL